MLFERAQLAESKLAQAALIPPRLAYIAGRRLNGGRRHRMARKEFPAPTMRLLNTHFTSQFPLHSATRRSIVILNLSPNLI